MFSPATMLATMVICKVITPEEATKIGKSLFGQEVPRNWEDVVAQFEKAINRKLI